MGKTNEGEGGAEVGQEVKCNQQLIHDVIHQACRYYMCVCVGLSHACTATSRRVKSRFTRGREGEAREEERETGRAGAFNKVHCPGMGPT